MTGGRNPWKHVDLSSCYSQRVPVPPSAEQVKAEELFRLWVNATAFRRAVNRKLRRQGTTFTQWRFLHTTELLVEEVGDMVSQQDIGRRAGIDENTASTLMQRLARKGWLSVGIGGERNAYRLFVTDQGKALLAATRRLILAAGAETWETGCAPGREPTSFAP